MDAVIHGMAQEALPVTAVGAGVFTGPGYRDPNDPPGVSSYAGRLYRILRLGALDDDCAKKALVVPAAEHGVVYQTEALQASSPSTG